MQTSLQRCQWHHLMVVGDEFVGVVMALTG
jgi:hypothetical protein